MNKNKDVTKKETVDVMEAILFTDINVQLLKRSTLTSLKTPLDIISCDWGLQLKKANRLRTAFRILTRSVKCN